jgi:hypothetical protein
MAVSVDLSDVLDEAYEDMSLKEPCGSSIGAGWAHRRHNQMLSEVSGIQTVAELGSNKYFALAGALVALPNKIWYSWTPGSLAYLGFIPAHDQPARPVQQ